MSTLCILIPSKNRKTLLARCLQSIFNQTEYPDEIIVVNDGSSDGTKYYLETLKDKENLKLFNREVSGGVNVARHQGIKMSSSEWIATLDDDDEFFPDAVSKIKKKLATVPADTLIVFFNSVIVRNDGIKDGGFMFLNEEYYDLNYTEMMTKFRIKGDCKPVFNKKIFDLGYRFPESVNGLESYLFYLAARDGVGIR
ncbi:MAG: glycosyltransferase family 2 protein, partial [Minisyncoccia bacterium]